MKVKLRFFLDEGVARSVGVFLESRGHDVIYAQEAVAEGSSDDLIALTALANNSILVADDKDMKTSAKRHKVSPNAFKHLSLLQLRCKPTQAAGRIAQAMDLIESEWLWAEDKRARRLFVEVLDSRIVTNR